MPKPIAVCDPGWVTPEQVAKLEAEGYVVVLLGPAFGKWPPVYVVQPNDATTPKVNPDSRVCP